MTTVKAEPLAGDRRSFGGKNYIKRACRCPVTGNVVDVVYSINEHRDFDKNGDAQKPGGPRAETPTLSNAARWNDILATVRAFTYAPEGSTRDPVVQGELDRLRRDNYPALAAMLEERHPLPVSRSEGGLVPLGVVRVSPHVMTLMAGDKTILDDLLKRHSRGDLGAFGNLVDVQLSAEARWAPSLFGIDVQAVAALEIGSGFIRSRHGLAVSGGETVELITFLGQPSGPATLVFCPHKSVTQFA